MMRVAGVLGILMLVAVPALGDPVVYTFDLLQSSELSLEIDLEQGAISTVSGLSGTFAVTIYQSSGHIGESTTYLLEDAIMANTDQVRLDNLAGLATATLHPGSAAILDFLPGGEGHIGSGGDTTAYTDAVFVATVFVTGLTTTTLVTVGSADQLLPMTMNFTTSVSGSDTITALMNVTIPYEILIPDFGLTITLDMIVHVEATAHVVPDPALGGFTALGLGGASAWLRRRRS